MAQIPSFYCDLPGLSIGTRPPFPSFGYWLCGGGQPIVHLSGNDPAGNGVDLNFADAAA